MAKRDHKKMGKDYRKTNYESLVKDDFSQPSLLISQRESKRSQIPHQNLFSHNFSLNSTDSSQVTLPHLLKSKHIAGAFTALLLQQLIVVSSNVWLLRATDALLTGGSTLGVNVALFFGSMLLPYLPGAASLIKKERWKSDVTERYMDLMIEQQRGQLGTWNDKALSEEVSTVFTNEAEEVIAAAIDATHDVAATSLNIIFSVISLSILVNPRLAIAGTLSLAVGWLCLRTTSAIQKQKAEEAQNAHITHKTHAQRFNDHVMIGNSQPLKVWKQALTDNFNRSREKHIANEIFSRKVSLATTFFTSIPILGVTVHHFLSSQGQSATQTGILVTIPRLLQSLLYVEALCSEISMLPGCIEQLRGVRDTLALRGSIDFKKRIDTDKLHLTLNGQQVELNKIIEKPDLLTKAGRWTLRGDNRAGKSSLLYAIKLFFAENAYYLPAQHEIIHDNEEGSTGQQAMGLLRSLLSDRNDHKILLLDEWDAHLSSSNRALLECEIELSSASRPIFDVTHFARDEIRSEM